MVYSKFGTFELIPTTSKIYQIRSDQIRQIQQIPNSDKVTPEIKSETETHVDVS